MRKRNPWLCYVLPTSFLTVLATLVVANLGDQQQDIAYRIRDVPPVTDPQFQRTMENMMGPTFTQGNRVTAYQNGDEIFPAMLGAISGARRTINFESYIYLSGRIGDQFIAALSERAKAGVKVHLLLDWAGSKLDEEAENRMRAAGVEIRKYHPLSWYSLSRLNNRTHRKILVVDGKVGFTGGVGISDDWLGNAESPAQWRDSHYRVVGPVVGQLQAAFTDNWLATSPQVLHEEEYFPWIRPDGPSRAQVFKSSPREGAASSQLMHLMSIAAARKSIRIANPYFVPGELALEALLEARRRGVRVEVIVPGEHIDLKAVRYASRALWGPLLEAGVEIHEFQPTMFHCKLMIIDDAWVSVGSTNFDDRSFRLNSESNLNIVDPRFAAQQVAVFDADRARSRRITLEAWRSRPGSEKALEKLASVFSNQL